jgi:integrase
VPSALESCITAYLREKRAAGRSRETLAVYTRVLQEVLLPFCRQSGITEPGQLGARELNALSAGLLDGTRSRSGRPLSMPSVASYARTINVFLEWLAKQGETVSSRVQKPRLPKRVVDVLSREDIRALEDAAPTERDKLIVRILADTGVRLGELLAADPLRQEPDRKWYLKVRGKGDKERMVPIQPGLATRIDRYARRTRKKSSSGTLFLGNRRSLKTGEYEPLTASEAAHLIRDLGQDVLKRRVHPHLVRRSFVTEQRHSGDG